jgi:hypothetical protein
VQAGWIQDLNNYPQVGDYMGAYDGDPATEPDYITGEGIETTHFTGDVSGIDLVLHEITVIPPSLAYGFHFLSDYIVVLCFNTAMDEAALGDPGNYSININSGEPVVPEDVTVMNSHDGVDYVALSFGNHAAGNLVLGDTLSINISTNVVSESGVPMDESDRNPSFDFLVDLDAAGFDETMITYDDPSEGNVTIGSIGADPDLDGVFHESFTPVNDGAGEDYLQVWAYRDSVLWGDFVGSTNSSPNNPKDLASVWDTALETVDTVDTYEAITVEPEYPYQYTLSYVDTNQDGNTMILYSSIPVTMQPTLPLDDSRVDVTINYSYTGSGTVDDSHKVVVFLCYEPGGAPFAYRSFNTATGTAVFDDPLVPLGDTVYAEVYYDADASMAPSENDPYTQYTTGIAASGGTASVSFDDSAVYSSGIPDTAGVWMTSSWGGMTMFFTEDAFSFTKTVDGSTTYGEVGFVNNYGTIVAVDNTQGYFIGQLIHHPSPAYVGKYLKVGWTTGGDFTHPEDVYHPFDTVQEAIDSVTPTDTLSGVSGLY